VARYRLSEPAKADIAALLRTSQIRFGSDARTRYRAQAKRQGSKTS